MSDFIEIEYPISRVATFDVGSIAKSKHHITGLIEVDVTLALEKIARMKRAGEKIGFTAWLLKVVASTIENNGIVHAVNSRGRKQLIFNDIDISIPIEREVEGKKVPLAAVIRKVNEKSIESIFSEMQALKNQPVESEKDYVLGKNRYTLLNRLFFNMPQWARILIWKIMLGNPFIRKDMMGTVILTNIGTAGSFSGWIIPRSMHNLCIGIGSVNKKPWAVNGEMAVRDILHMTILFDHDVIDGSPAARFTAELIRNMEDAMSIQDT